MQHPRGRWLLSPVPIAARVVRQAESLYLSRVSVAKYRIPDAVAGATVLAVGTSFPELIIGFASQFLMEPEPSIPVGVTAGSAIFNQLAIAGACVLCAQGGKLKISWRAMLRDILLRETTIA